MSYRITTNYIVYTAAHRRRHAGSQREIIIPPPTPSMVSTGDTIGLTVPSSLPDPDSGANLPFAFMSVTGTAYGNLLYTTHETAVSASIHVGTSNIKVLIVYTPAGGLGEGLPAVYVDAFNVETGDFSDSDFMQVYTNGLLDDSKTATANNDGIVSSDTAEDMRAYNAVDGIPFLEWLKIGGSTTETADYNLQMHENGFVFAFYQAFKDTPVTPPVPYGNIYEIAPGVWAKLGWGLSGHPTPGGGDKPYPGELWSTLPAKLLSTVAILSLSSNMSEDVKAQAVDLAVKHLYSLAEFIKTMEIK